MMGTRIEVDNPNVIRVALNTWIKHNPPITVGQLQGGSTCKTIELTALMVQMMVIYKRVWETWALTQMIMKVWRSFPHCPLLLLLCSHPMLKQPGLCTIMNSRSSDVTPVMRLGTSLTTALSAYKL